MDDHLAAEEWRASGCGMRISVREEPTITGAQRICTALDTCGQQQDEVTCEEDELALLTVPVGWLARTLVLSNPYPILDPPGRYCGTSG